MPRIFSRFLSLSALLPFCLLLAACNPFPDENREANPALWLASGENSKIYLLGSIHSLPRKIIWEDDAVAEAIATSDLLVLELAPSESAKAVQIFETLASRSTPIAIEQRLKPEVLEAYHALPKAEQALFSDQLDDWAIMILLGQKSARDANLSSNFGVEAGLTEYFREQGKKIIGLETAHNQLMIFETLDADVQNSLLSKAIMRRSTALQDVAALLNAWAEGDMDELERRIDKDIKSAPQAYKLLIEDRNLRWAEWTARQLEGSDTILIAVGAGHMIGETGLPSLLEKKGFKVERLQ